MMKRIMAVVMTLTLMMTAFDTSLTSVFAQNGVARLQSVSEDLRVAKYSELAEKVTELSGNIDALIATEESMDGYNENIRNALVSLKGDLTTLSGDINDVKASVLAYIEGRADGLSFTINQSEVAGRVLSLAENMPSPANSTAAAIGFEYLAADCEAVIADSVTAIERDSPKTCERAMLGYVDAVETIASLIGSAGFESAFYACEEYEANYGDPYLYVYLDEENIRSAAEETLPMLCYYYGWLLYYYKLVDYRDYLEDDGTSVPDKALLIEEIDKYTFGSFLKADSYLFDILLSYFRIYPNNRSYTLSSGGALNIETDETGLGIRLRKYEELKDDINAFLENWDEVYEISRTTVGALSHARELEHLDQFNLTLNFKNNVLSNMTAAVDEVERSLSDYYNGRTSSFSIDMSGNRVLMYDGYERGLNTMDYFGTEWVVICGDPGYQKQRYDEVDGYVREAKGLLDEVFRTGLLEDADDALQNYSDSSYKMSDWIKCGGFEKTLEAIQGYYTVTDYSQFDEDDYDPLVWVLEFIGRYYEWLLDWYKLIDYRDYLANSRVNVPGKAATIELIDKYTFGNIKNVRKTVLTELLPQFKLVPNGYEVYELSMPGPVTYTPPVYYYTSGTSAGSSESESEDGDEEQEEQEEQEDKEPVFPGSDDVVDRIESKITSKPVRVNGKEISVTVKMDYNDAVYYSGKKITPKLLGMETDFSGLFDAITYESRKEYDPASFFETTYVNSSGKNAGKTGEIYARIEFDSKKAKQKGLKNNQIREIAKLVKAVNKSLRSDPCTYRILPLPLDDEDTKVIVDGEWKKGKFTASSVKIKTTLNGKSQTITLEKGEYKIKVLDADAKKIRITGKNNVEGSVTKKTK